MGKATLVLWLAEGSCTRGPVCWLESHSGSAAWLQGAGTLVAIMVAAGAYFRFRWEGFRPRMRAQCNPDGQRAVLSVSNVGRAAGTVDDVLVGKGRRIERGYRPVVRPHQKGQAPPCILGPGETIRLLLEAQAFPFTGKSVRVGVLLGEKVRSIRARPLSRGLISDQYFDPSPAAEPAKPEATSAWESARRELDELAELRRNGRISRVEFWIGRYRSIQRAQQAGPPPRTKDSSAGGS